MRGPSRKTEIENNIRAGISRLKSFQIAGGGLTYWPGGTYADDWGTNYAGHFMLEMDFANYTHDQSDGMTTKAWNVAPFNLKAGLFDNNNLSGIRI